MSISLALLNVNKDFWTYVHGHIRVRVAPRTQRNTLSIPLLTSVFSALPFMRND
jgi:hypothetical protein